MASETEPASALSYRERDVDETLDDHDTRINRLEKVSLVFAGYLIADGQNILSDILTLIA